MRYIIVSLRDPVRMNDASHGPNFQWISLTFLTSAAFRTVSERKPVTSSEPYRAKKASQLKADLVREKKERPADN